MRPAVVVGLALTFAVSACGVGEESTPRQLVPPVTRAPAVASAVPEVSQTGPAVERLCLIKNGLLVAVARPAARPPSADTLLADLLAGPNTHETEAGFTSALSGTALVAGMRVVDGVAVVALVDGVDDTARTDAIPAFGQIVCTLTTRPDIGGVTFTRDGQPIKVPRADALLTEGPLTTKDYADIIAPGD